MTSTAIGEHIEVLDHFKFLWDGSADDKRYVVLQGGAGSGKSKSLCQRLVYMFLSYKDLNIYIVRASMPILKRSVYLGPDPSIVKELSIWGCPATDWLNKTENTITNPYNGSVITFIGLDNPEKIKSINANYVWIEEATELNTDKFNQLDLRLRRENPIPGKINQMFISYNPISYNNWVIRTFHTNVLPDMESQIYRHFSNFTQNKFVKLENVKSWLSLAENNEMFYQTYVLGIPGVPMGQIYQNITFQNSMTWPQDVWDVKPYYGIDWGFIDPMVLMECRNYDGKVYVRCMYHKTEHKTSDLLQHMKEIGVTPSNEVYYDSAEADRGAELLNAGFTAYKAFKNIKAGISHLQSVKIIFDDGGEFGEVASKEILAYTWEKDPEDQDKYIDEPIETDNHVADAMRYAIFTRHLRSTDVGVGKLELGDIGQRMKQVTFNPSLKSGNTGVFNPF